MKAKRLILPAMTVLIAVVSPANAVVVIDNLSLGTQSFAQTLSGPTATGFFGIGSLADREIAFSFTTGSQDVYLTELVFAVAIGKLILDPIQFTLSTGSAVPGGTNPLVIGSVTPPSSNPTNQVLTLVPQTTVLLESNTTYWMNVTVPNGAAVYSFQNTTSQVIEPGWSLGNTWSNFPGSTWSELTSGPQARIRMSVEAVPEPSAAMIGGCGMLMLLRRRRK
jgi:hypothetical protein